MSSAGGLTHITHFMRRPRPNVFSIERLYEDVRASMPADCRVKVWTCSNWSTGAWPRLKDIWHASRNQNDVNHVTGDVHFLTFLLYRDRTVLTIHDLVSLERLRGARRWLLWLLWYWLPVRRSRMVVTISETTRRALLSAIRCDPGKIRVIHNNVSDEFQPCPRPFPAELPRILQIGTNDNKNLERVAAALEGLPCRLTVVGPLTEMQTGLLRRHKITFDNHVGLTREALLRQYVEADVLVFASTYEGFGLPIVEAQAVGRPVVTSNVSSMPEVAGGSACLVDPFDVTSIRAGIRRVIEDVEYRADLVAAGARNVERFRAAAVAEKYAALYREIAATPS
jgi:glycosyltransferase involved in cell wall biosynthesis